MKCKEKKHDTKQLTHHLIPSRTDPSGVPRGGGGALLPRRERRDHRTGEDEDRVVHHAPGAEGEADLHNEAPEGMELTGAH